MNKLYQLQWAFCLFLLTVQVLLLISHLLLSTLLPEKLLKDFSALSLNFKENSPASLGEGNGTRLQYSCLENPMDGGAWWAVVHGVAELDRTEWLHFHFSLSFIEEGNGNPLQCSCLENPRDRRAWWAAVYGVTQNWIRLKRLSSSSSTCLTPGICTLSGH